MNERIFSEMASKQDAALPSPNSKIAKTYFANVSSIISRSITIEAPASDCQVYIPRPSSLTSFTDSTLDALLDSVKFNDDDMEGYEHRFGGKLITFNSPEAAKSFLVQLPVDVVVGKKTHRFHSGPPIIHSGVRVRVMGLPRPFSAEQLEQLGQAIALDPSHLVHHEMLHSRRGKPTDKGLLIFEVCPFALLVSKTLNLGGYDIQFIFLNRETHCHECGCAGHSSEFCYLSHEVALPTIYVDDDGYPSFSPPEKKGKEKDKEKEKSKDSNSKKSNSNDVDTAAEADKAPGKGRGRNR